MPSATSSYAQCESTPIASQGKSEQKTSPEIWDTFWRAVEAPQPKTCRGNLPGKLAQNPRKNIEKWDNMGYIAEDIPQDLES